LTGSNLQDPTPFLPIYN